MVHGRKHAVVVALLLLSGLLLASCSAASRKRAGQPGGRRALLRAADTVLVLPFREGSCLPVHGSHVRCHLTGADLDAGEVPRGSGVKLAAILFQQLRSRDVSVISYNRSLELVAAADPSLVNRYEPALAIQLGQAAGAGKVLMGVITRYEERSGSGLGGRLPAAVAFSLALVEVPSGNITHRARFNRRQAPLAANLLALPRWWRAGFHWWTRREVAEQALEEAADALVGRAPPVGPWTDMPLRPGVRQIGEWETRPSVPH